MKPRVGRRTVRLAAGDVRMLVVARRKEHTRLVILDQPCGPPLIQALLALNERKRLALLLGR
jgi:hypothetical protein